jgi:L-lysine 2,3-aminomutase
MHNISTNTQLSFYVLLSNRDLETALLFLVDSNLTESNEVVSEFSNKALLLFHSECTLYTEFCDRDNY